LSDNITITGPIPHEQGAEHACKIWNWLVDYENTNGKNIHKEHKLSSEIWLEGIYAFDSDTLIGGLTFHIENDWVFLSKGFILPEYRGLKIYSTILRRLEQTARKCGMCGMFVSTYDFEAPHVYEHMGFTRGSVMSDMPRGNTNIDCYKVFTE
jgi:GNAT superfamily N-acetyltransferase